MKLDILIARQFFADFFYGEHHLPGKIKPCGEGWEIIMSGELATTDFNDMTRLVLMAHQRCIRVSVKGTGFRYMKLMLHARDPQATGISRGHPTLSEAIASHEKWLVARSDTYKINPAQDWVVEKPKRIPTPSQP